MNCRDRRLYKTSVIRISYQIYIIPHRRIYFGGGGVIWCGGVGRSLHPCVHFKLDQNEGAVHKGLTVVRAWLTRGQHALGTAGVREASALLSIMADLDHCVVIHNDGKWRAQLVCK